MVGTERDDGGVVGDIERDKPCVIGNARVPRRGVELAQPWRLRQFPRQRMFAPARAQQQDIHGFPFRAL